MPIHKSVNKDFFKIWTHGMAYVLGFFAADGYITVNRRGGQFWCIQITDKALLKAIKHAIQSEHVIGERKRQGNESTIYRLQIGSKEMCDDLRHLGFTERKTKNIAIPLIPQKYFSDFVRGYFDGDGNVWMGYINKKRDKPTHVLQATFTSGSLCFLQELMVLLHKNGIKGGYIYSSQNKDFGRLTISTLDALKLYEIMYNNTDKCTPLLLKRKKLVFEKFKGMRS